MNNEEVSPVSVQSPLKMKILLLEPGRTAQITEISASLRDMQRVVGGLIEPVRFTDEPVRMIVNEEGKLNKLPWNRILRRFAERPQIGQLCDDDIVDVIAGTCFLCGIEEDHFTGLSEEQLERYCKVFYYPDAFALVNGQLFACPYNPGIPNNKKDENCKCKLDTRMNKNTSA